MMLLEEWLPLSDVPPEGKDFSFQDDPKWSLLWERYEIDCRMIQSLTTVLEVLPQAQGVYFRGKVQGQVSLICSRCLERGTIDIKYRIEAYENYTQDPEELPRERPLKLEQGRWWFSPELLAWEHFVLALPDKPLCDHECKGLCPKCGENINFGLCSCTEETLDPRLAVLRNLKINR